MRTLEKKKTQNFNRIVYDLQNKPSESSNSEGSSENAQTVPKTTQDSAVKKSQERKRHNCGTNLKAKKPKLQAGGADQPVELD